MRAARQQAFESFNSISQRLGQGFSDKKIGRIIALLETKTLVG
jgi:hypothetical protein